MPGGVNSKELCRTQAMVNGAPTTLMAVRIMLIICVWFVVYNFVAPMRDAAACG